MTRERLPLPEPDLLYFRPSACEGEPSHKVFGYVDAHMHAYSDAENAALLRWRSTNAQRLEALQGLLEHAQAEAAKGVEAIASLASEREANAILTGENAALAEQVRELRQALKIITKALGDDVYAPWQRIEDADYLSRAALEKTR